MSQHSYFITLTLVNSKVIKNFKHLISTYEYSIWILEKGKTGNNPHIHAIISGFPEKIRSDNITTKFKKKCYVNVDIPDDTRRLVRTKYVDDLGTLYNCYFKKEDVPLHIKGYEKEVLDKMSIKKKIQASRIMGDKTTLTKQNAPYMMREYAIQKKLYDKEGRIEINKVISGMIKDDYVIHHLFGRTMNNIIVALKYLEGNEVYLEDVIDTKI